MADLEDDLRRVLSDPAHALPPWPDVVQRVRTGIRRRYGRRLLARLSGGLALVLAALTAAVVPSLVTQDKPPLTLPTPSPSANVIPWQDLPYADPPQPSLSPRPVLAACRLADLGRVSAETDGAGGTTFHRIRLRNDGSAACTLRGRPLLRGVVSGQRRTIATRPADRFAVPGAVPATIEPGETAELVIETYGGCLDGRRQTVATAVTIAVGRDGLPLGDSLNTTCGVGESEWRRLGPEPTTAGTGLSASITGPVIETPERDLVFVVTVTNTTDAVYILDPCPNYITGISLALKVRSVYRLNCADERGRPRTIPPGGSLDFAMRLPLAEAVPAAGETTGPATITWTLDGGAAASAAVTIR